MQTLQQTLLHTPWWVYALFIYLIIRGVKASRTRVVSLKKLLILPVILLLMSGYTLLTLTPLTLGLFFNGLITFLIGVGIGYCLVKNLEMKVDREQGLVQIQGSWITLILILIIFISKYYIGYTTAVHPDWIQHPVFINAVFAINGVTMGMFIGRLVHYFYCYTTKNSVKLSQG